MAHDRSSLRSSLISHSRLLFSDQKRAHSNVDLAAPVSPTPPPLIDLVLDFLSLLPPGPLLLDLGCGDGRWPLAWVSRDPSRRAIGYDVDAPRLATARRSAAERGLAARATFVARDVWTADPGEADVIVVYLFREAVRRMADRLDRERHAVVSVGFALPAPWVPDWTGASEGIKAYVYRPRGK